MKAILLLTLLVSTSVFARTNYGLRGDKIQFQKHSTWVSVVYNKTLCIDGETYFSDIRKCLEWERDSDDRVCKKYGIVKATQPMHSTRQRCAQRNDDRCTEWETVKFTQKPVKEVSFLDEDGNVQYSKTYTVPNCK